MPVVSFSHTQSKEGRISGSKQQLEGMREACDDEIDEQSV